MGFPRNGIYVVQGEMSTLITAMKRGNRWSSHAFQDDDCDSLSRLFVRLHDVLRGVGDLQLLDPQHYMEPFLEVIRSEETTGPVTSLALSAVSKFLSYNLIDPSNKNAAACVENIADAVTRARFVGTDQASDGVVLMKILQVLRILVLSPLGQLLRDDSVCEIVLSCFRICFETRLSELLRQSAEHCLKDIVQLLFSRLPELRYESASSEVKKLKIRAGAVDLNSSRGKRKHTGSLRSKKADDNFPDMKIAQSGGRSRNRSSDNSAAKLAGVLDMQGIIHQGEASSPTSMVSPSLETPDDKRPSDKFGGASETDSIVEAETPTPNPTPVFNGNSTLEGRTPLESCGEAFSLPHSPPTDSPAVDSAHCDTSASSLKMESQSDSGKAGDTPQPVSDSMSETLVLRDTTSVVIDMSDSQSSFPELTQSAETSVPSETRIPESCQPPVDYVNPQGVRFTIAEEDDHDAPLVPYGVLCVRQLFHFLVSLCNPLEKQNTETMQHTGLALLTVALEVGADSISQHDSLLAIVKDNFCRNLFTLMTCERLSLLVAALRASFLVFESMRVHLKFQQERYFLLLADIITTDSPKVTYDHKEAALEALVQLWRVPGLVTELYLNYDCDLYCSNVLEDITKILSKNTFPVNGLYSTHLLSLEALLTVIDSIERHCHSRIQSERQEEITDTGDSDRLGNKVANSNGNDSAVERNGQIRGLVSRRAPSPNIPSHEQLMAIKRKKKLLATGTEHFNTKPKKGIAFLQDQKLLSTPLDPNEVVHFLRENPRLDKKMIGDYISNRENLATLDCFVKSFDFTETRIDEALRLYLETFRLPGEAPLISLLMEHFANHWHKCNGEPFANSDAAFTLAYAVIMLNVDQHNNNVKKQNIPMTAEDFKRNLKKVNGDDDFDQTMLDEIYESIRNDEIVMPAEQSGLVRENYLWKVLLRRGTGRDGIFLHAPAGLFDHDLFSLIWGPSVAALSFVFDRSSEPQVYQRAIAGFLKCALISAHYGMSNDFDNLIISLCKFTTLINSSESVDTLPVCFGANVKAQLATQTVFSLALRHGDILRLGWASVLDCLLQLYRCRLLPKALTEAEDFIEPNRKVSLLREEAPSQKAETGLLSSLYSYIALSSEPSAQRASSPEDIELRKKARQCIRDCHLEQIITESKFLRLDSLQELIKALILAAHGPDGHPALGSSHSEGAAVFFLELLLKVIIQNRDRVSTLWPSVRDHLYSLLTGAVACEHHFLMERCVVGLLRLAIGLMRREEMSPVVLQSLRMLLLLKWNSLARVSRNVAYGLYELLKTSAANIHSDADWSVVFTLLECVGAGAPPPRVLGDTVISEYGRASGGAKSDGELQQLQEDSGIGTERVSTSDSELSRSHTSPELSPSNATGSGWILVGREGEIQPLPMRALRSPAGPSWDRDLLAHDPHSLVKCCESLAFLVRDVAHITPYNYEYCVHCIRTFVEASLNTNGKVPDRRTTSSKDGKSRKKTPSGRRREESMNASSHQGSRRARSPQNNPYDADESDSEEVPSGYHQASIQLLDLMHTLHTRTAQIYRWWAEESGDTEPPSLWATGWCPLLQGIARLCCDSRREVCTTAMSYLPRALLVHDLQTLTPAEWESCFRHVLFPLLARLLEPFSPSDPAVVEETRMRAATVLSKVFLHHLTPLLSLPSFSALWFNILDLMQKYMHADRSDLLLEAIPESLKNMLLVMDSAGVFSSADGRSPLWDATWERVDRFLPGMRDDLFKSRSSGHLREAPAAPPPAVAASSPQEHLEGAPIVVQPDSGFPASTEEETLQLQEHPPTLTHHAVSVPALVPISALIPTTSPLTVPIPVQPPTTNLQFRELPSPTNVILQAAPSAPAAPPTTLLPHMGQLVSTPIPGPVQVPQLNPTPACVLEAFTPTTRACPAPPTAFSPLADDGVIPASRYFVQNQTGLSQVGLTAASGGPVGSGGAWLYRPEDAQ